jgi:ATP-dependent Clp protease ATP-binding subunit ClpA
VHVDDLDIPVAKLSDSAQRVMDSAVVDSRRREHAALTSAHLFVAIAQAEWDLFAHVMRDAGVNPNDVLRAVDEQLRGMPSFEGVEPRVSPTTKLVCRLAFHHAKRAGRSSVDASDLLVALFEERCGVPVSILRQQGADPAALVELLGSHVRDIEMRNERLKKRFELPSHLQQRATNLNLLAWLDKLPPVFGRNDEIQEVLEILSHRERSNSVMLVGEPGVGKTAIAEGLARRIEFEPDSIPVRLRAARSSAFR